jgi:hypothetical protein
MPSVGFETAISANKRPQTYSYNGARNDTTQHSGQTPDDEVEIIHFIACGSGYIETDPRDVLSPNNSRISDPTEQIRRSDILARHLLQVAYDFGIRMVNKTYLIELMRECRLFWDQRDRNYDNRDLKLKSWDEIREKLNYTCRYRNNDTNELQYSTNFKQRLLIHQQIFIPVIIRCIHHVPFTSSTMSKVRKVSSFMRSSLDRHVGLKVATHVWPCMPRQRLVCCVESVLAPM